MKTTPAGSAFLVMHWDFTDLKLCKVHVSQSPMTWGF